MLRERIQRYIDSHWEGGQFSFRLVDMLGGSHITISYGTRLCNRTITRGEAHNLAHLYSTLEEMRRFLISGRSEGVPRDAFIGFVGARAGRVDTPSLPSDGFSSYLGEYRGEFVRLSSEGVTSPRSPEVTMTSVDLGAEMDETVFQSVIASYAAAPTMNYGGDVINNTRVSTSADLVTAATVINDDIITAATVINDDIITAATASIISAGSTRASTINVGRTRDDSKYAERLQGNHPWFVSQETTTDFKTLKLITKIKRAIPKRLHKLLVKENNER